MFTLGIETSCDETAASVVEDGSKVLSSVIASQDHIHDRYGGIVPELASRNHIETILKVVEEALSKAQLSLGDIHGIAVTKGPGLIGSLLVGLSTAKAIGYALNIPVVGVHHIEGHLTAALLGATPPSFPSSFPLIGFVASGGHTSLYRMCTPNTYELLGQTRDDAAGECFDKVAKLCGLPFPGGPSIEKAAQGGNPHAIRFPHPNLPKLDFSFSGLKTAVALWIRDHGQPQGKVLSDLAASFQETMIEVLITKLIQACEVHHLENIVVCGGVAKNQPLRSRLEKEASQKNLRLFLAPLEFCTDNAAMIAAAGFSRLLKGERDDLSLNAQATIPISSPI